MKPEIKLEGDVLKVKAAHVAQVDTDKDGEAAVKASIAIEIEADASEVIAELIKSETVVAKMLTKLKELGLIKE